jgi:hypothetical protein
MIKLLSSIPLIQISILYIVSPSNPKFDHPFLIASTQCYIFLLLYQLLLPRVLFHHYFGIFYFLFDSLEVFQSCAHRLGPVCYHTGRNHLDDALHHRTIIVIFALIFCMSRRIYSYIISNTTLLLWYLIN